MRIAQYLLKEIAQYLLKEKSDLYPLQIGADTPHYGVDPHNNIKHRYTISYIKPSVTATVDTGSWALKLGLFATCRLTNLVILDCGGPPNIKYNEVKAKIVEPRLQFLDGGHVHCLGTHPYLLLFL